MSNILFGLGKQHALAAAINITADAVKATLLTMTTAAGKISLIGSSVAGPPIALTTTGAHGYAVGDIVVVGGHTVNTCANGTWQCGAGTSGITINLATRLDNVNATGNGAGGATGWVINISSASVLADVSANSLGTDATLTAVTNTLGVVNSAQFSWSGLAATKVWAIAIYDVTASNDLVAFIDGAYQVYMITQAGGGSTALAVARMAAVLPNLSVLNFSDGTSATLSAQNTIGDTSLAVSGTTSTIHRQATADVPTLSCGLPVTPAAGGTVTLIPDSGANKLFVI